jgi:D-3-phosphoglycerate dehydrogenase
MYPLIVIVDSVFTSYKEEQQVLSATPCRVEIYNPQTERDLIDKVEHADAVLVNLHKINNKIIQQMKNCKIISRYGVGVDNVDIDAATEKKIWVAHVPDYCVEETADHALALLLTCAHSIAFKDKLIREGMWNLEDRFPVARMNMCILGIIGYGKTGRSLHRKVSGLGLSRVLVCDPYVSEEEITKLNGIKVELDELLRKADFISLHVPLNDQTFHLLGNEEIGKMKSGAVVINTSRGAVIDEKALAAALENKRIMSAGLDVFEREPLPLESPLRKLSNVVLTDHTSYYSIQSRQELKMRTARNVLEVLKHGRPLYAVNKIIT